MLDSFASGALSAAVTMFEQLADQFPEGSQSRDTFQDAADAISDAIVLMERVGIL